MSGILERHWLIWSVRHREYLLCGKEYGYPRREPYWSPTFDQYGNRDRTLSDDLGAVSEEDDAIARLIHRKVGAMLSGRHAAQAEAILRAYRLAPGPRATTKHYEQLKIGQARVEGWVEARMMEPDWRRAIAV